MNTPQRAVDSFAVAFDLLAKTGIEADDPAELLHETSKFSRSSIVRQSAGLRALAVKTDTQTVVARSAKRLRHVPQTSIANAAQSAMSLAEALAGRRSARAFGAAPVPLDVCAAILHAAYGVTETSTAATRPALRAVASAGALYPLELYVIVRNVSGLKPGLYHYDPLRATLGALADERILGDVSRAMTLPDLADSAAFLIVISAVFLRSRFKYGLRGYRFVLLEAGHVAQNALLAAQALDVGACPLGAFFDHELDAVIGLDGILESSLYLVAVGARA